MRTFTQRRTTAPPTLAKTPARSRTQSRQAHKVPSLLHVQRMVGNTAVQRMVRTDAESLDARLTATASRRVAHDSAIPAFGSATPEVQTNLAINTPGDRYEQQADRVAEQIMRLPAPHVQRTCACGGGSPGQDCDECTKKRVSLQRMSAEVGDPGGFAPPIVHDVLRSPAGSLDGQTQALMGAHFGRDFSRVRIHADADASHAADAVQAHAFTVGSDIVFGSGQFAPATPVGRKLLAHELTHVVQQGAAPPTAEHAPDPPTSAVTKGRLQRQPKSGKPAEPACPPIERGEREEAAKAQLQLVERIPQQEWLIYGFPIGGSEISGVEAGRFISAIVRSLMQGRFVYVTGQDPLEVLGFSDCFAGPRVDNHVLRQLRATGFCAGVMDHYSSTPKTYPNLIRSCGPAPADQYVGSNATRADRAQNRSILIRRVAKAQPQFQEGNEVYPYNPKYGPSREHCAAYTTDQARRILGPVYTNNAHCSCLVTPDEPHNNCVRDCLQNHMWNLLANASRGRKPNDPPMDINIACPLIWKHHRDCYRDCGCASGFIDYLAFDAVCNIALPCAVDSAAINLLNRCMPATKNDKYLPVP